jgi:hypothetical protein
MQSSRKVLEWRDVDGYDNYKVSDTGLIRNKNTGLELKTRINKSDGREYVGLLVLVLLISRNVINTAYVIDERQIERRRSQ